MEAIAALLPQVLIANDAPTVEIVADSANQRSQASSNRTQRLLAGFSRERATLNLAMRGVSPDVLEPIQLEERDLASTQTRAKTPAPRRLIRVASQMPSPAPASAHGTADAL